MNRVSELTERYFGVEAGELIVEGMKVSEIAAGYGTPFYLYCPAVFGRKLKQLQELLSDFEIHYSVKANPNPDVVRFFIEHGCGLEIASAGELYAALSCGCRPDAIIFAGPGKTDTELAAAIEAHVGEIHVESVGEIERLARIAEQHQRRVGVSLRINPGLEVHAGAVRMGGRASAFGIEESRLGQAAEKVMSCESLVLKGLHVYAGTQILDDRILLDMYRYTLDLAGRLGELSGKAVETIDFGGGFGVPYFEHESELEMESFARDLRGVIDEKRKRHSLGEARLVIEPGRYLTAEGGLYVTSVVDRKSSYGQEYVILDGGMNHNLAASGNLGQVIKRNYPIAVANRMSDASAETVNIAGPLCTPIDTLGRNIQMPEVAAGDIVVFFVSGAYGLSASPTGFLSHAMPLELFIADDGMQVVRNRTGYAGLFAGTSIEKHTFEEIAVDGDR